MAFLLPTGILLLAIAAALLARAVVMPRVRVSSQIRQIETYGFHAGDGSNEAGTGGRSLLAWLSGPAERIGRAVGGRGLLAPVEARMLRAAGMYSITPETFQGYRVMAATGVPGLLLLESLLGGSAGAKTFLMVVLSAGICWLLPPAMVRTRGQRRMDQVDRALPELIDVLTATVEAGLGFAGSLQLVAARFDGPLGQELRLMLREQSMGLSTEQALSNLLERCDTPSVRAFARAVTQGESLGVSIGTMLRNLASETRKRRRQMAREQIMKAPVKMLFPLVFLIFPALFIVLLYPAGSNVIHMLGGH
jgi:tight adherence protein C